MRRTAMPECKHCKVQMEIVIGDNIDFFICPRCGDEVGIHPDE